MRLRTKILLVAFCNIAVLVIGAVLLMTFQYGFRWESALLRPAEENILNFSRLVGFELEKAGPEGWESTLARLGQEHGLTMRVVGEDGDGIVGGRGALPAEVLDRVKERPPPFDERKGRKKGPPNGRPVFLVASSGSPRAWIGVRMPIGDGENPPRRASLLMAAPSWFGFPFFPDFTPFLWTLPGALGLSALCWWPLLRGITRSVAGLAKATQQLAEGKFDVALAHDRRDELGDLSVGINRMAEQLRRFVHGQKRFLGDIAHELSSPVARLQFASSILELKADPALLPHVTQVQQEVAHMSALVNELLAFTKAGLQSATVKLVPVAVGELVERVIYLETAGQGQVTAVIDPALVVQAQPEYLTRAVANLVRNAIRYAGPAGPITISAEREAGEVAIRVMDCGPGLPVDQLEKVFEPFHRVEASRGAESGGVGLGLAIVKSCVEACGGKVTCRNRIPVGLEVEMRFAGPLD